MQNLPSGGRVVFSLSAVLLYLGWFSSAGYAGSNQLTPQGQPRRWKPNTPIPYVVNPNGVPGLTGELQKLVVLGAVNDAYRAWTEVAGAAIAFSNVGTSALTQGAADEQNLVSFQDTSFPFPPGVLGVAVVISASSAGRVCLGGTGPTCEGGRIVNAEFAGQILDADILFNPNPNPQGGPFSPIGANNTVDLVAVAIHEVGHLLGLDHSGILSSIMNPFSESGGGIASRKLETDDRITAAALYPAATFAPATGTISGAVTSSAGAPVNSAHVIAVSHPGGAPVASQLSGPDGRYTIAGLPPGNYRVMVEPLDGPIGQADLGAFYSDGLFNFATTFLGGLASPATVSVSAGQPASNINIALPETPSSPLNIDRLGLITPTQTGTLFTFGAGPQYLPRGKSYQLFVTASNQTSDSNLTFTGADIAGGATTGDALPNGQPIRQQTISIAGSAAIGPSNILLSNAVSTSAFPGGVITTVNPEIATPLRDGAGFGTTLAPGAFVSIFSTERRDLAIGRGLAGVEGAVATPLPTSLGGVSVKVGDRFAPLFFVSPGQINALIPFEISGPSAPVTVVAGPNAAGNTVTVSLSPTAPGIFSADSSGAGQGAILNVDNSLVAPVGSFPNARPARPGDVIVIFASGLGQVTPALPSGVAAGAGGTTIPALVSAPRVTIGGQAATVQFAGLAPGFVGLYQVNAVVPPIAASPAAQVQITTAEGQTSNAVSIAVTP